MNRRTFLTRVCGGIVGAAVVASLPLKYLPEPIRRRGAIDFLWARWHEWTQGKPFGTWPHEAIVGSDLFDVYEREIIALFRLGGDLSVAANGGRALMFKSAKLYRSVASGWFVTYLP